MFSYKVNAERLGHLLETRPYSSRELLSRHVEFVIENGPFPLALRFAWETPFVQLEAIIATVTTLSIVANIVVCIAFIKRREKAD